MPYGESKGMETVKVKCDRLLTILKDNRKEHREIFVEAVDGYRKAAIKALDARLDEVKKGLKLSLSFRLEEPQDMTKQYDLIIKMLEMSIDTEIELTQKEFANYVQDDWSWMGQFLASNSGYSQRAAGKLTGDY